MGWAFSTVQVAETTVPLIADCANAVTATIMHRSIIVSFLFINTRVC